MWLRRPRLGESNAFDVAPTIPYGRTNSNQTWGRAFQEDFSFEGYYGWDPAVDKHVSAIGDSTSIRVRLPGDSE